MNVRTVVARALRWFRRPRRRPRHAASAPRWCLVRTQKCGPLWQKARGTGFDGYRCEVVALGSGPYDSNKREVYLGGYWADTPGAAVSWLRTQALRIADRLDPQPDRGWARSVPFGALLQLPDVPSDHWPDCGRNLWGWSADSRQQQVAETNLRNGVPFTVSTSDLTARYFLRAVPASLP